MFGTKALRINGRAYAVGHAAVLWDMRPCRVRAYLKRGVVPRIADGMVCRDMSGKRLCPVQGGGPRAQSVTYWRRGGDGGGCEPSLRGFAFLKGLPPSTVHACLGRGALPKRWGLAAVLYQGRWCYRVDP